MTDSVERLHTIRAHLRTGRFGQREVWEEWLTEAADEIDDMQRQIDEATILIGQQEAEIERRALEPKP